MLERPRNIIFKTSFGSQLYGTTTPESDTDIRGVYIPSARDILLGRIKKTWTVGERDSTRKNTKNDVDEQYWSLDFWLDKACQGDTNAIDLLFAPTGTGFVESEWLEATKLIPCIISKRVFKAALGYMRGQVNKYGIKGSRMAAAEAAVKFFNDNAGKFANKTLGDAFVEHGGKGFLRPPFGSEMEFVEYETKFDDEGRRQLFLSVCGRRAPFGMRFLDAARIYQRLYDDYGERARKAKDNEGIDWKAVHHAARCGVQMINLDEKGFINFPFRGIQLSTLMDIKTGRYSFRIASDFIESLIERVEEIIASDTWPDEPDREACDEFLCTTYRQAVIRR